MSPFRQNKMVNKIFADLLINQTSRRGKENFIFRASRGFSLLEMVIAMGIGIWMTTGAVMMYSQSSNNYKRMGNEILQVGNGQYVANLMRREIQSAGYWGDFLEGGGNEDLPQDIINPCSTDMGDLIAAIAQPVVGYNDVIDPGQHKMDCLSKTNFVSGTDILVIRRADSRRLGDGDKPTKGDVYIQSNVDTIEVQIGDPSSFVASKIGSGNEMIAEGTDAAGKTTDIFTRANNPDANPQDFRNRVAGDVRKYHVDIFFISPCTIGSDGGNNCKGGSDDGGDPKPSLKKLELVSDNGELGFRTLVVAEGVEDIQIMYGLDRTPARQIGDVDDLSIGRGVPNEYVNEPLPSELNNVVNLNVVFLVRSLSRNPFLNNRVYDLGSGKMVGPSNDYFSRQLVDSNYRLSNIPLRRERLPSS